MFVNRFSACNTRSASGQIVLDCVILIAWSHLLFIYLVIETIKCLPIVTIDSLGLIRDDENQHLSCY